VKSHADSLQAGLSRLERKAPDLMKKNPQVLSVYAFGSSVAGFGRRGSDIDIAVRLVEDLGAVEMFDLRAQLIDDFENLAGRTVDVVVLSTASLKMIRQVMKTGRLIYAADMKKETAFRLQKQKEYFDFQYYLQDDRKALKNFFRDEHARGMHDR
jgi:predicted nucleotidyltransferase